jgi:hypothetical protein
MMLRVFLGRIVPLGLTILLLRSSFSPIQPALAAFAAATRALAGEASTDSGAAFPGGGATPPPQTLGGLRGLLASLTGSSPPPPDAKAQLDEVIRHVKERGSLPRPEPVHSPHSPDAAPPPRRGSRSRAPAQ